MKDTINIAASKRAEVLTNEKKKGIRGT